MYTAYGFLAGAAAAGRLRVTRYISRWDGVGGGGSVSEGGKTRAQGRTGERGGTRTRQTPMPSPLLPHFSRARLRRRFRAGGGKNL